MAFWYPYADEAAGLKKFLSTARLPLPRKLKNVLLI